MYKLLREKRKTISIRIDNQLGVIVKAPHYMPKTYIDRFVQQNKDWIERTKQGRAQALAHQNWQDTHKILYLGEYKNIIIMQGPKAKVTVKDADLVIEIPSVEDKNRIQKVFEQWVNEEIREIMTEISDKYCKLLGCHYNKIYIRKQKTRWGSCSSKGNLSYNSRLICAPRECIEYIALHEVMHLRYFNHGEAFWREIGQLMPSYKTYQNILKERGVYFDY